MSWVVEAEGLKKKYGSFTAVNGIRFGIKAGETFGFLGPNGAGKTSTVKMIHCFSPVTEGTLNVFGLPVQKFATEIKARLGVCHQEDNLDPDFTVEHNLRVFARYFGISRRVAKERATSLLKFMGIWEKRDSKIQELSGGMKRRLMIARSLMNEPDLLLLDEPTTGLDPQSRHQVWDRVRQLRKQGKTVILTTHYMDEAQALCDRVVLMDHGKILLEGPPSELIRTHVGRDVLEVWGFTPDLQSEVRNRQWVHETYEDRLFIYSNEGDDILKELRSRFVPERYVLRPAGLEDLFLIKTGRELRE